MNSDQWFTTKKLRFVWFIFKFILKVTKSAMGKLSKCPEVVLKLREMAIYHAKGDQNTSMSGVALHD